MYMVMCVYYVMQREDKSVTCSVLSFSALTAY